MFQRNKPIIIAGILSIFIIGGSYLFLTRDNSADNGDVTTLTQQDILKHVRGISEDDHILGNPTAPIIFFVYSDFSCPYCKDYHKTMKSLMNLYGSDGQFAWVYRHLPYVQLHPEAPMYALASECVAQEVGDFGFWKFTDELYNQVDPLSPLGASELVIIAEYAGATRQKFVTCMRNNELMAEVEKDFDEAIEAGAEGSPFTIIHTPNNRTLFQGAQPFRTLAVALQTSLRSLEATTITSPSSGTEGKNPFIDEFDDIDISSPSLTPSTTTTQDSILDGIVD